MATHRPAGVAGVLDRAALVRPSHPKVLTELLGLADAAQEHLRRVPRLASGMCGLISLDNASSTDSLWASVSTAPYVELLQRMLGFVE